MINKSIIVGIIAGMITYITLYFYNKYNNKQSKINLNNIDIIPVIIMSLLVWWTYNIYFEEQINIDDIPDINTILCK